MWPFSRKPAGGAPSAADSGKAGRAKTTAQVGQLGEKLARQCLRKAGLKILADNYRCPAGEADLIALDKSTRRLTGAQTIVFVEVKTRTSDRYTDPHAAVDADKRRRMKKIADYYVRTHNAEDFNIRFDIVSIVLAPDQPPAVKHIPDAF